MADERNWKVIESEIVFNTKFFKIRKDNCVTPRGVTIDDYYVQELPDSVLIFPITINEEVLMVSQYRHGVGRVNLDFPAGRLEKNEKPEDGALRELLEETGYKPNRVKYLGKIAMAPDNRTSYMHIVLAEDCTLLETQKLDKSEDVEIVKYPFKLLPELIAKEELNCAFCVAALMKVIQFKKLLTLS